MFGRGIGVKSLCPGVCDRGLLRIEKNDVGVCYGIRLGGSGCIEHEPFDMGGYLRRFNKGDDSLLKNQIKHYKGLGCLAYAPCLLSPSIEVSYVSLNIDNKGKLSYLQSGGYTLLCIGSNLLGDLHSDSVLSERDLFSLDDSMYCEAVATGSYLGAWSRYVGSIVICMSYADVRYLYAISSSLAMGNLAVVYTGGSLNLVFIDRYVRFVQNNY